MSNIVCILYSNFATLQGPRRCPFNLHFHEVAWLNATSLVRLWEEDQFVGPVAAFPLLATMAGVFLFNQYLLDLAKILLVDFEGNGCLQLFHGVQAVLLFRQRDVILPASGDCTRAYRVGCYVYDIEADFFRQVECMLELWLGVTAKVHDHISRARDTWPQLTYHSNLRVVLVQR